MVGTNKLNEGGYVYEVDQVVEQDFDPKTMEHDLALIKIKDEFKFNDKFLLHPVKAIRLFETEVQDDEIAKVTGWGLKKVNDPDSPNDLQVIITFISILQILFLVFYLCIYSGVENRYD